ncbi:MAG: helix-turn-helix domain-containing protein [Blastocatellia bacterium]
MQDPLSDNLIVSPQNDDVKVLRDLATTFATAEKVYVRCDSGEEVELPESATEGFERLISYLSADMAVAMKPYDDVLTTRQAAELLGMSRPYLVRLLETEAIPIPFQKVGPGEGGHRRIMLRDVVAYRRARTIEDDVELENSAEEFSKGKAAPV